ncbi:hypothetical protein HYX58_04845 [Candidatus Dependentiae bacterium]|nr:hypothetical protein [Candidatus Dependentiae bacterium]
MLFFKRFKLQFSLLALCCVSMQTLPVDYFDSSKIETTSQATGALLAFGATAACALYCGYLAKNSGIQQQRENSESEVTQESIPEDRRWHESASLFARARNYFLSIRNNRGNAGNPLQSQSFNIAPYFWGTISGLALIRSAVLARALYDYYSKTA